MNNAQHAFELGKHIVVGESQKFIPARSEPSIANVIPAQTRLEIMRGAVNLHDQSRRMTDEIDNVSANGHLSPKLQSVDVASLDITPQQCLGARHRAAKRFRPAALPIADHGVRHSGLPPSLSLPRKGGGNPKTALGARGKERRNCSHPLNPPASVGKSSGRKP
jgi:hypothetical protein